MGVDDGRDEVKMKMSVSGDSHVVEGFNDTP